jgi:hypothetical protein
LDPPTKATTALFFKIWSGRTTLAPIKQLVDIKPYYRQYLQEQDMTPADFKGVTLDDLVVLEQVFSLNVYVYDLQET